MNKIYMTKRGHDGKTVVCSEKTRARGKVKSLVLAIASATAVLAAPSALAAGGSIIIADNTASIAKQGINATLDGMPFNEDGSPRPMPLDELYVEYAGVEGPYGYYEVVGNVSYAHEFVSGTNATVTTETSQQTVLDANYTNTLTIKQPAYLFTVRGTNAYNSDQIDYIGNATSLVLQDTDNTSNVTSVTEFLKVTPKKPVENTGAKQGIGAHTEYELSLDYNTTQFAIAGGKLSLADSFISTLGGGGDVPNTYFHANTGDAAQAAGNATTNLGSIDSKAGAMGDFAVTAGVNATAGALNGVAVGHNANSTAFGSIAIGGNATATGSTAKIDTVTRADGVSYDRGSAIAIGNASVAGVSSVALGEGAYANGTQFATAIGTNATSTGQRATAVGQNAKATGGQTLAMGHESNATNTLDTAIGSFANATGGNSLAVGSKAATSGEYATALGYFANATGKNSVSLGASSGATGIQAAALTSYAKANGKDSIAAGVSATTTAAAERGVAIARQASVSAVDGIAIGYKSSVTAANATTLGANTVASHADAVAIGSYSVTREATKENTATVNGVTYSGFAGNAPASVVSFGTKDKERQLVNVAAGNISATSTDAINGSQLYLVAAKVAELSNNVSTMPQFKTENATTANINPVQPIKAVNMTINNTPSQITGVGSVLNTTTVATNPDADAATAPVDATLVNLGNATNPLSENILNSAATVRDIANLGWVVSAQDGYKDVVKNANEVKFVSGSDALTVNGTTTAEGIREISISLDPAKLATASVETTNLTVNNGGSVVVPTTDGSKLVNATTVAGAINNSGWTTTAVNATTGATENVVVNPGEAVNYVDGDGTIANVTVSTVDGKDSVSVSFDVDKGNISNKADGSVTGPAAAAEDALTQAKDALAALPADATQAQKDAAQAAVDAAQAAVNKAGNQVATAQNVADAINKSGFTLTAQGKNGSLVSPGEIVDMKNTDGNINITKSADNNDVVYNMAPDVKIEKSVTAPKVNADAVTIGNVANPSAPSTTLTTVEGGNYNSAGQKIDDTAVPALSVGGNQITNVANGAISPSSTDAINGSQLYALQSNISNQIGDVNNRIDGVEQRIGDVDDMARAGIAGALATAGLPQVYLPGKSLVAVGAGTFKGESGLAVSFSSISDNGSWILKGTGSTNTQGDVGGTVAVGYQW